MRPSLLSFLLLSALLLAACHTPADRTSASVVAATGTNVANTPMPDELYELNRLFLSSYKARRAVVKSSVEPLIVASFDTLTFTWRGVTETNDVIPEIYHSLKAVAHVPIGLYFKLQPVARPGGGDVPPALATELQAYRDHIAATAPALAKAGFHAAQRARQEEIFRCSLALCDDVKRTGKLASVQLDTFARALGPALLANAADAAIVQLTATHAVVMQWRQRVPAERWRELTVVVRGPQTPRRLNIFTQYFARILNEPGHHLGYPLESRHLIYVETLLPGRDHLDLMATTFMDGDVSEAFFGDRWLMSRDLLGDAVKSELRRLKF